MGQYRIDYETRERIIELRAQGLSFAKIAEKTGVAKQTAVDECRREEEKIATLRAFDLEELYEKHRITKEERIKAQAKLLNRIKRELDGRNLSDIPTDKLIELYSKQTAALRAELIEPNFHSSEEQELESRERELLDGILKK